MAKTYISDIQPNQDVLSQFIVAEKQLRVARNGTPFLTLRLADKTGEVVGRMWEGADVAAAAIPVRGVVLVSGRSELYREELQLQIREISVVEPERIDPSDYLPVCPISPDILFENLKKLAADIKRRPLHQLMRHILGDRPLMELFKRAPAAKAMHHAYLGGLLEHTVSVARLAARICDHYGEIDRDLLISGAILHDIGKVREFCYETYIDYSNEGRLLGHMILGVEIVEEKIGALKDFPPEEGLVLKHLILSHHGETEFGAVKLPMTREAFVLHFVDDLDAKMNSLGRILSEPKDEGVEWTSFQQPFGRFFYRGSRSVSPEPAAGPSPDSDSPAGDGGESVLQLPLWPGRRKGAADA